MDPVGRRARYSRMTEFAGSREPHLWRNRNDELLSVTAAGYTTNLLNSPPSGLRHHLERAAAALGLASEEVSAAKQELSRAARTSLTLLAWRDGATRLLEEGSRSAHIQPTSCGHHRLSAPSAALSTSRRSHRAASGLASGCDAATC